MANPTNKGVGTGSAALYDYGVLNTATDKFFKGLGDNIDKKKLEKAKSDAKQKKINDQLAGKLGDYDPTKLRVADQDKAFGMYQGVKNKWNGRYGEISKDPQLANEYAEDMAKVKTFMGNSANSVKGFADHRKAIRAPNSGYTQERIDAAEEYMKATGSTISGFEESGLSSRDMIIGNLHKKLDAAFSDGGKVLYETVDIGPNNRTGASGTKSQKWVGEDKAFGIIKATVSADSELLQDFEIKYPGLPFDEQIRAFIPEYRKSRELEFTKSTPANPRAPKSNEVEKDPSKVNNSFEEGESYGFNLNSTKPVYTTDTVTKEGKKGKYFWSSDAPDTQEKSTVSMMIADVFYEGGKWYARGIQTRSTYDNDGKVTSVKEDHKNVLMEKGGSLYNKALKDLGLPHGSSLNEHYNNFNSKQTKGKPSEEVKLIAPKRKTISKSEIEENKGDKTTEEYTALLKRNGVKIID